MSGNTAKGLIAFAALGMFAIVGVRRGNLTDPFRQAWAVGVVYVGLSLLADISPEVAGPLALLALIAVYAKTGKSGSGNLFSGSFKLPGISTTTGG